MVVFFSLFAACADSALSAGGAKNEMADAGGDTGDVDDGLDTDTQGEFVASWFSLRAQVGVAAGQPVADGAVVTLVLADEELTAEDCALSSGSVAVAATPAPEGGPALAAWWEVVIDAACAPVGVPARLGFGVGELSPEVRARLGTVDLEGRADELYGAWLSADDLDFFPFGYADAGSFDASALPDGTYELEPLLVVALGE